MAHLTLVVQGREVRKFVLKPSVTTIGRAQDNDIVINNLALSRRHAEVHLRSGRFEVEDLGSQNGVFVNNSRIRGPQRLGDQDTITLGTYQFVFTADPAQARAPSPPPSPRRRRAQEVTQLEAPEELAAAGDLARRGSSDRAPLLVLKYNDVELQRFPVMGAEVVVGRAKDCDIQIAERRLSRRHCKVFQDADGGFYLTDLGSQNGTYVNRRRIPQFYELNHGDVLNFAEYSILYLADATQYDGPDRDGGEPLAARPSSDIGREETEFPEAYAQDMGYEDELQPSIIPHDDRLHPSEHTHDPDHENPVPPVALMPRSNQRSVPDPSEPFVERPVRARERRTRQQDPVRDIQERRTEEPRAGRRAEEPRRGDDRRALIEEPRRPANGNGVAVEPRRAAPKERPAPPRPRRPEPTPEPPRRPARPEARGRRLEEEHRDVEDVQAPVRPDSNLDDWYDGRDDSGVYQEEPSVLLERSKSSMSQILSTMMVGKRDLDRNLKLKSKRRRFSVRVTAGTDVVFSGPLEQDVTILGTDAEADIQLRGRYVAGRHSLLVQVRDSLLLVRLGSSSAARVNGLPKLQAFLKAGDVVQIDETTIEITE